MFSSESPQQTNSVIELIGNLANAERSSCHIEPETSYFLHKNSQYKLKRKKIEKPLKVNFNNKACPYICCKRS